MKQLTFTMMLLILFNASISRLIMPFFVQDAHAIEGAQIAVYNDDGAWSDGVIAFEHFLDWKGITYEEITANDVNIYDLKEFYDAIYFPGGYSSYYWSAINDSGIQHIRTLVNDGGGYIGICAGAFFAADTVYWEGVQYDYPLNLFQGTASGAIDSITPWPLYKMTTINLNSDNPINEFQPFNQFTLYYGGPAFYPNNDITIDTVATWEEYEEDSAIINFNYGDGQVLLIGPHLEIEEDSSRDGTTFADELNDLGTEWGLLWSSIDWVLGWEISDTSDVYIYQKEKPHLPKCITIHRNYPNPFNPKTTISFNLPERSRKFGLRIYDVSGKLVKTLIDKPMEAGYHSVTWKGKNNSGKNVASGLYFFRIQQDHKNITRKMILLR